METRIIKSICKTLEDIMIQEYRDEERKKFDLPTCEAQFKVHWAKILDYIGVGVLNKEHIHIKKFPFKCNGKYSAKIKKLLPGVILNLMEKEVLEGKHEHAGEKVDSASKFMDNLDTKIKELRILLDDVSGPTKTPEEYRKLGFEVKEDVRILAIKKFATSDGWCYWTSKALLQIVVEGKDYTEVLHWITTQIYGSSISISDMNMSDFYREAPYENDSTTEKAGKFNYTVEIKKCDGHADLEIVLELNNLNRVTKNKNFSVKKADMKRIHSSNNVDYSLETIVYIYACISNFMHANGQIKNTSDTYAVEKFKTDFLQNRKCIRLKDQIKLSNIILDKLNKDQFIPLDSKVAIVPPRKICQDQKTLKVLFDHGFITQDLNGLCLDKKCEWFDGATVRDQIQINNSGHS